jgi:DNA-directed RNA polymerase sigma subunit (sigma70/sigma32)
VPPPDPRRFKDDGEGDEGWDADGFGSFLNKAQHRILTMEEEKELGRRISNGRLAERLLDSRPDLDAVAPRDVRRRVEGGKTAADELAQHNIRLVVSIAGRLSGRATAALSMEDLVQEGYIGLAHAITK